MIRLAADENFNFRIVRGLTRSHPEIDIVSVHDAELAGADDPTVLDWAATDNRVLLTHDVQTMTRFAWERVENGLTMPGLFEVSPDLAIGLAIEEIAVMAICSDAGEFENQVCYIPWQ